MSVQKKKQKKKPTKLQIIQPQVVKCKFARWKLDYTEQNTQNVMERWWRLSCEELAHMTENPVRGQEVWEQS